MLEDFSSGLLTLKLNFSSTQLLDIFLSSIAELQIIHQENNTIHDIACKLVTRYGDTSEAYNLFNVPDPFSSSTWYSVCYTITE